MNNNNNNKRKPAGRVRYGEVAICGQPLGHIRIATDV